MYRAADNDGLLDVMIVKKPALSHAGQFFINLLNGEENKNPAIMYFQAKQVTFSSLGLEPIELDLDGEYYGDLPVKIEVVPQALSILVP